jgi:hypothetical protein
MPNARLMVTIAGSPSGTAAMARLPRSEGIGHSCRKLTVASRPPFDEMSARSSRERGPGRFGRRSPRRRRASSELVSLFCSGAGPLRTIESSPHQPICVCMPVATTTPLPRP